MSRRALFVGAALTAVIFWMTAGITLCEGALRVPRRAPPIRPGPVQIIAADGVTLRGSFLRATAASGDCVLVLHGIGDSRAIGFAPMFLTAGYSVLAPDGRGHGLSGGDLVTFGVMERDDTLRWATWMRANGCKRLFGLGESLGAAILIQAAAEQPVFAAIVAECSYTDLPAIAEYRIAQIVGGPQWIKHPLAKAILTSGLWWARVRYGVDLRRTSAQEAVRRLSTPLLLIHGDRDVNTPPEHSKVIHASSPSSQIWIVPGASHVAASAREPEEFRRRVLQHLK